MFGGGTLTINVQIVESHFDDYDLYLNGFAQMTTSVFTAYNPNYKNIIDAFVADPNEKTKMIDFIESKRIALLQRTVDSLAAEYTQIARTITAIDNGEWPAKYKGEYQHHLQLIEDSLAHIKNNYGLTPSQTNSATPISM